MWESVNLLRKMLERKNCGDIMKAKLKVSLGEEKREKIVEFETNNNIPDKKIFEELYSQCEIFAFDCVEKDFTFEYVTKDNDILLCRFIVVMGNEERVRWRRFERGNLTDNQVLRELWERCDEFVLDCVTRNVEILER